MVREEIQAFRREFRHFTFVELAMVALILGMVSAAAVPRYSGYLRRVRASEAIVRLGTIMSASKIYYQQHGRWPDELEEDGYYADFSPTRHFSYDILKGGGEGEFVLQAKGFDFDNMKNVVALMSCQDVTSQAIIEVRGVWKGEDESESVIKKDDQYIQNWHDVQHE